MPLLKKYLIPKDNKFGLIKLNLLKFVYYALYSLVHIAFMMLIMSYNGGVLVTMIIFMGIAYFLFGDADQDSSMPINCCAHN